MPTDRAPAIWTDARRRSGDRPVHGDRVLRAGRAFAAVVRRGSEHRAGPRAAARDADGDDRPAGQHSGVTQGGDEVSRERSTSPSDAHRTVDGDRVVTLRLLSYNIRHGGAGREAALASVIRMARPDVVVLQEATRPAVIEQLARDTGLAHWGSRRGESLGYMSRLPARSRAVAQAARVAPRVHRDRRLRAAPGESSACT